MTHCQITYFSNKLNINDDLCSISRHLCCTTSVHDAAISAIFLFTANFAHFGVPCRPMQFSVWDRTGPRTGSDRTGPLRSGLRSVILMNSVFGPVPGWTGGPVGQTDGPKLRLVFFSRKEVAWSCCVARADHATFLPNPKSVPCSRAFFQFFVWLICYSAPSLPQLSTQLSHSGHRAKSAKRGLNRFKAF